MVAAVEDLPGGSSFAISLRPTRCLLPRDQQRVQTALRRVADVVEQASDGLLPDPGLPGRCRFIVSGPRLPQMIDMLLGTGEGGSHMSLLGRAPIGPRLSNPSATP